MLIALTSTAMGSGKSTAAEYLKRRYGFHRLAFADTLKAMTFELYRKLEIDAVTATELTWGDRKEEVVPGLRQASAWMNCYPVCRTLVEQTGLPSEEVERLFFTDPSEVIPALGICANDLMQRYDEFCNDDLPDDQITSRRWQQLLGTEFGRLRIKDSLWVDIALARAATHPRAVIDDMRFPNELEAVRAAGGVCYRVNRPDAKVTSKHASEGGLDHIHLPSLYNTAGIDYLHAGVDAIMRDLLPA